MENARRDFIKMSVAGIATTGIGAHVHAAETAAGKSEVITGKGTADAIIPKIFDRLGGIKEFVKPGARVLIKPNMSFANPPEQATGTTPEALRTVVKLCLDAGARRVVVCDNTLRDPELCKEKTGLAKAIDEFKGVALFIPKQDAMFTEKTSDNAKALTRTNIVRELDIADCFINLPCAKSHSATGVSLGIKGMMGLIQHRNELHSKMDLHMGIAELLYYMRPTITIVDATRALLDNGPAGPGKIANLETFVGGLDPVAVDSYTATIADWYGRKFEGVNVKYIKNAMELGFGNAESAKISEVAV